MLENYHLIFLIIIWANFNNGYILQVTYMNVISPLAELEAQQFPLVQSCVFPKMVTTSDDVHKASAEAERRIDTYLLACRYD